MSDDKPIALEGIPVFTGNLATLDVKVTELSSAAETIATTTGDVHSSFGGLQAFYQAPEAEQLFATTKPVVDTGQTLKSDLTAISRALSTYSDEVYPLVEKLKEIKRDAGAFLVKINADDKWREDGDLIDENNHRRDQIADTLAAFQDAEIACYNKIVALVCGVPLKKSDGSDSAHQYGFDAETYKHAEGLPWGDPLVESIPGWQVWEHAWEFTKGFFVDGVWGTIKGLGTLVGYDGFDAAGQAWKGLAQLATGVVISVVPVAGEMFWSADDKDMPGWLRDSRTAVKETGKALLAWDQWGENPSRAAGAVTFNVVTTVFTGGTGAAASGAGKGALAAKALTAAGKVGRFVDPMTYVFKGAGVGLSKIGDVMAGLKNLGKVEIPPLPDNVLTLPAGWTRLTDGTLDVPAGATLPDGAVRLPNGTVRLPEGTIALPEGTVKNPFDEGAAYAGLKGNLYDEHGNVVQKAADAPREAGRTTDTDTPDHTRAETPARQPVLAGAGARAGDGPGDVGRAGDKVPGGGIPGGVASHIPHNNHTGPTNMGDNSGGSPASTDAHTASESADAATGSGSGHADTNASEGSGYAATHGPASPADPPLDPQVVNDRIRDLDDRQGGEGHAPGRHLYPDDAALRNRLGTVLTDMNGTPKVYGPNSSYPGLLKSENNIDPLTGTTVDGVHGRAHRVGPFATRFDDAQDMVRADAYFRDEIARTGELPTETPIAQVLGAGAEKRFSGFYRDPADPSTFKQVDFTGGTINPVYKLHDGNYVLHTMFANPTPGRHP